MRIFVLLMLGFASYSLFKEAGRRWNAALSQENTRYDNELAGTGRIMLVYVVRLLLGLAMGAMLACAGLVLLILFDERDGTSNTLNYIVVYFLVLWMVDNWLKLKLPVGPLRNYREPVNEEVQ